MISLCQYLHTLASPQGLTRTLGQFEVCRDQAGELLRSAGNSAVVFRIRYQGVFKMLKCYTRALNPHIKAIYGDRLLEDELFVYDADGRGRWVSVVLDDWIEGITLQQAIEAAVTTHDRGQLTRLSTAFDALALTLLEAPWAHGDLKPENIILTPTGTLQLIDFDAAFLPTLAGSQSPELGTAAFRHPHRTSEDFDASLDDFPIALISTALHALSLDPTLYARHPATDGLLLNPQQLAQDPAMQEILTLLTTHTLAARYRIARLLFSPVLHLFGLRELLDYAHHGTPPTTPPPALFADHGLWGFHTPERVTIPPLYDSGFDFTEGLAAVCLNHTWHFIDTSGRCQINCSGAQAVKPFRNGRARLLHGTHWTEIDHNSINVV